ncbi:MAG: HAD family hydrolase [Natronomonas sp.]
MTLPTGYLFDLDETLVTYEPSLPAVFRAACDSLGVPPEAGSFETFQSGYVETFVGFDGDPYRGAAEAVEESGVDVDPEALKRAYIERELNATTAPDGIADLLESLPGVGVVTNGYGPIQQRKLTRVGLDGVVDRLVAPDEVGAFKPDPRPFDAAAEALQADSYVMVGDSYEKDVTPAAERGYRTVLVGGEAYGPNGEAATLDGPKPDLRIGSPAELPSLLDRLRQRDVDDPSMGELL